MKLLGVHGRSTVLANGSSQWTHRAKALQDEGVEVTLPQFDSSEDPTYESWKETLDMLDIESYDVVLTTSHGSGVFARYVQENNIHIKRAVFCCPGRGKTGRINTWKVYDFLENNDMNLEKNIDEIYIIHSTDDEVVPYSEGLKFQEQIGGKFVSLSEFPHSLGGEAIGIINDYALWKKS